MKRLAWCLSLFVNLTCLTLAAGARAQASAADRATAQALFDDGKDLMNRGQAAEACPKLEESLRLDPAIGTRYQLAKCYELTARTASAWTLYLEVAAEARAAGQSAREDFARKEASKLEPALSHLTIIVPDEVRVPGLELSRNGVDVGKGAWSVKLPVDPGRYTITAKAPGRKQWQGVVEVHGPSGEETLVVPKLAEAPAAPEAPGSATAQSEPQVNAAEPHAGARGLSTRQWVGIGLAGGGVVALGVSAVFGLNARSKDQDSDCNPACATDADYELNKDARRAGNIATVTGIVGGVLLAGGAVVVFTAKPNGPETVLVPSLGPGLAGLRLSRSF